MPTNIDAPPTGWSPHPNSETLHRSGCGGRRPPHPPIRLYQLSLRARLPGLPCTAHPAGHYPPRRKQGVLPWPIAARSSTTIRTWRSSSRLGKINKDVDIKVFTEAVRRSDADTINDLKDFDIVVMMRERTRFSARGDRRPAKLKLLITTGAYNASIDMKACQGATSWSAAPAASAIQPPAHHLRLDPRTDPPDRLGARADESGVPWQTTLGMDIEGKTLGVLGLGKLGGRAAGDGKAFGMKVIAWSQNLTPERCKEVGADHVSKDDLFRNADVVTVHLQLSDRTRGLVTAKELG